MNSKGQLAMNQVVIGIIVAIVIAVVLSFIFGIDLPGILGIILPNYEEDLDIDEDDMDYDALPCQITAIRWADEFGNKKVAVFDGDFVFPTVQGRYCEDEEIEFTIWEREWKIISNAFEDLSPNIKFSEGTASYKWKAKYIDDGPWQGDHPEYFFEVKIVSTGKKLDIPSDDLAVWEVDEVQALDIFNDAEGADLDARNKLSSDIDVSSPCKFPGENSYCVDLTLISDKEIAKLIEIRKAFPKGKMEIITYELKDVILRTADLEIITDEEFSFYLLNDLNVKEKDVGEGEIYVVAGNGFIVKRVIEGNGGIRVVWDVKLDTSKT